MLAQTPSQMKSTNKSAQAKGSRQAGNHDLRIFVSHCVDDKKFVFEVCDLLGPYVGRDSMFLFEERRKPQHDFLTTIHEELTRATLVLIFVGKRFDSYMEHEALQAVGSNKPRCI